VTHGKPGQAGYPPQRAFGREQQRFLNSAFSLQLSAFSIQPSASNHPSRFALLVAVPVYLVFTRWKNTRKKHDNRPRLNAVTCGLACDFFLVTR
jgi:hypothetical protein